MAGISYSFFVFFRGMFLHDGTAKRKSDKNKNNVSRKMEHLCFVLFNDCSYNSMTNSLRELFSFITVGELLNTEGLRQFGYFRLVLVHPL